MQEVLLQTKLFVPPLRPLLVPRPRLFGKLDAGLQGKSSLLSAPTGFGKTTQVVHWLQRREQPVAWLSLDEGDSRPLRFFTYLVAALQGVYPDLARPGGLPVFLDLVGEPMRQLLLKTILGESIYASRLLRAFEEEKPANDPEAAIQLTPRESEILELIAAGCSNKEIEERLFISKNTVGTHIKNLYSKLNVQSRTQAINRARSLKLLK